MDGSGCEPPALARTADVCEEFEEARQRFAALLERTAPGQPLLVAAFRQLEACLAAGQRLEERQWCHLRGRLAARWQGRSEAACRQRLEQLAERRRQLAEQQLQLDGLLTEARRQLQQTAAPPADLPSRLLRKWERLRRPERERQEETDQEHAEQQRQSDAAVAEPPPPPSSALKPWLIEGLSVEEACDKRRLLERCRQLEADTARLLELRDTQYRPAADYSHCIRRYFSCVEKSKHSTDELMKVRTSLRLHAAWVRDRHRSFAPPPPQQQQGSSTTPPADPTQPSEELRHYDRQWEEGLQTETTAAGAGAGAAAARAGPPLSERLLYSRLDAVESRALVAEAAERGSWREVEFALAHDRLTLTADCVLAMFVCCRCRGRCSCQWTRLAVAAQKRLPERPPRTRGWGWRKVRMATQLIRLLHSTKTGD